MVGLVEQDRLSLRGDWGLLARMRAALRIYVTIHTMHYMIMKAAVLFLICLNSEAIFFSITLKQTNKKNSYSVAQNSV